jgi:hypothetical protein
LNRALRLSATILKRGSGLGAISAFRIGSR